MSVLAILRSIALGAVLCVTALVIALGGLVHGLDLDTHKLWQVARLLGTMRFIEQMYVEEVDPRVIVDGAINGMVKALGDQHSAYLDEETYARIKEHSEGAFGGIGIVMGFDGGKVQVMSVMEGTPAEAAGILKDDEILAVEGEAVKDMEPELVAKNIRGKVGTEVHLLIHRAGQPDKEYTMERDTIHVKTTSAHMLENDLGYIRLVSFSENTAEEFEEGYKKLLDDGMKGLIIDLRANPGGLINSCVKIGNIIVPEGPIVSVVERDGTKEVHNSTHTGADIPLVVLIDGNSASASEIIAGALQDTGAATLVGTTSYGKGSVQVVMPIPFEEDAVKLTIAKYYTPSGRSIHGKGVEPDVKVELDASGTFDNQLAKAVEVLKEKIQKAKETPAVIEGNVRNKNAEQL